MNCEFDDILKDLPHFNFVDKIPTVDDVPEFIKKYTYFVTGSIRFGRANGKSDIDIVVLEKDVDAIKNTIRTVLNRDILPSNYSNGFKYQNGFWINIIPLEPIEFCTWSKATKMLEAVKITENLSKPLHCSVFENLRKTCKLSFQTPITYNNYQDYI